MDIVVVMDGPDTVAPETDTSFALIVAAQARGHRVWHCAANAVEYGDDRIWARARPAVADADATPPLVLAPHQRIDLGSVDAVLVRTDPPFDATYLHLTLLLDHLVGTTLVVNAPRGLRDANEKLYACKFPDITPPTIVSADDKRIVAFAREHGAAVLKPIAGHGGRGVMALRPDDNNAPSIIDTLTDRGRVPVVAQRFLPNVAAGDKRILLLDAEPLGAILRIPTASDFRANICVGGSTVATEIDAADRRIIERIAPSLRADGLVFVGLDVVDGQLTEVNVTSPTGICQLGALTGDTPAFDVITWLERHAT
ncbi:MAG: glutathione synthase [Actinomycetota bacterium]